MKRQYKTGCKPMRLFLLAALALLASGCAAPQASDGLQQRIDGLLKIQQQQALQLDNLQKQLSRLTADNLYDDTKPPDQAVEPVPPTLQIAPSAAETARISEAAELYLEAFAAIATGQMAEAESGFGAFLERFPEHEYAGNANYWMAEALLSQQKTARAETVLLDIIDNPQQQNKAPAAMARLTNYYRENDAPNNAAAMLQMLSTRYPESPELKRLLLSTKDPLAR